MFVILGLILLLIALIVGLAGVLGNTGGAHTPTDGFSVLGYHVTGSTGDAFLYGIVVGVHREDHDGGVGMVRGDSGCRFEATDAGHP